MIGRIYKIIVNCSNEIYIGSTFQECRARWHGHNSDWNNRYNRKGKPSSFELFEKWGIENCKIILIKEYEVIDRCHLEAYEQLWFNRLNPINKHNPFYIGRFYRRDRYQKELERNPNRGKELYQKELERNPNRNKDDYQKRLERNPNHNKEKITCECGLEISKKCHAQHKRTKKHTDRMS